MATYETFFKGRRETGPERFRRKLAEALVRQRAKRRRQRDRETRRVSASGSSFLALAKGPTQQSLRDAEDRAEAAHIRKVHAEVFGASARCAFCGDIEGQSPRCFPRRHQMHEEPSRADTRGLPLEQRFSLEICCRTCAWCHKRATENVLVPIFADAARGWLGDYVIQHRDGRIVAAKTAETLVSWHPVETW